jgi:hypothetical protein
VKGKQMEIRVYKTMTGEDIIGRFVSEDDKAITLDNPRIFIIQGIQSGQAAGQLIPFSFLADDKLDRIELHRSGLMGRILHPSENTVNKYIQATSGLVLASLIPGAN